LIKLVQRKWAHNLKVNDYFEVSCRSKIDHIEVSFHAVRRIAAATAVRAFNTGFLPLLLRHRLFRFHLRNQKFPSVGKLHGIFTVVSIVIT
jgi:hypothetical protein